MFQPYSVKLTIEGLWGPFAEKYSCTISDAHHVHRLLQQLGGRAAQGPVVISARGHDSTPFEPFQLISRFIQYLGKIAAKQPNRRFFTGVRFEPAEGEPGEWTERLEGSDAAGAFAVDAWGTRAFVMRGDEEVKDLTAEAAPVFEVEGGRYVCQFGSFKDLFKPTFVRLVEMCEESIAKNAKLIASEIPHQKSAGGAGLPEFK